MDGFTPNPRKVVAPKRGEPQLPTPELPAGAPSATATLPSPAPAATGLGLPRKKSRKWLWVLGGIIVFLVAVAVFIISALAWYNDALQPKSGDETPVTIQVESGASIDQVANELEQKSIIKSALAFTLYAKVNSKDTIKTGSYLFAPNQSVAEIVQWLQEGRISTRKITILPGKTLKQMREAFIKDGFAAEAIDAAFAKTYTHPLLAEKPANATLEGYIYPETYFVTSDTTIEQVIIRTFDEFQKKIEADGLRQKLAARGFSLYQGITLASIIGKEVTKPDDQRQVAQVFELRLATGMMLGSDVTYHYAAELLGVPRSVDIDSPYNTRKYTGLPPGPIANFNLTTLQAVTSPASGNYLYFVAGDDGTTHFSRTLEEHQQNVQEYCKKLCSEA